MGKSSDRQMGLFAPDHTQPKKPTFEEIKPQKRRGKNWRAFYLDYFLSRPMGILIVAGLLLEIQPIEEIRPTYFWATREVNKDEIVLKGTEDEVAHKEGVKADTLAKVETAKAEILAQIEFAKECMKQREIAANAAYLQCVQSGKTAGYCRFVYEQAKTLECPEIPAIPHFEE